MAVIIEKYIIDACVLIDMNHNYPVVKKDFSHIWDKLAEQINSNEVLICEEVFNEIKDEELVQWLKKYKAKFIKIDEPLQTTLREVLKAYPLLIDRKALKSGADPFVVALAKRENGIVLTNEKEILQGLKVRIPNACKGLGISFINLREYIDKNFE